MVISRVTILITHIRGLITPLITTHEPSSKDQMMGLMFAFQGLQVKRTSIPRTLCCFGHMRRGFRVQGFRGLGFKGLRV